MEVGGGRESGRREGGVGGGKESGRRGGGVGGGTSISVLCDD